MILPTLYLQSCARTGVEATDIDVPLDARQQQHTQCDPTNGVWGRWGIRKTLPLDLWSREAVLLDVRRLDKVGMQINVNDNMMSKATMHAYIRHK